MNKVKSKYFKKLQELAKKRKINITYTRSGKRYYKTEKQLKISLNKPSKKSSFGVKKITFSDSAETREYEHESLGKPWASRSTLRKPPRKVFLFKSRKESVISAEFSRFLADISTKSFVDDETDACMMLIFKMFYNAAREITRDNLRKILIKTKQRLNCNFPEIELYLFDGEAGKKLLDSVNKFILEKKQAKPVSAFAKYSASKFGNIYSIDFYRKIIKGPADLKTILDSITDQLNFRCRGDLYSDFCNKILTELLLNIFNSIKNRERKTQIRNEIIKEVTKFETNFKKLNPDYKFTDLKIKRSDYIKLGSILYQIQDEYLQTAQKSAVLATAIHRYLPAWATN
jgi:hypothetical protein